ncbi:MAG: type II toxin-antitoxin system VapC family toxin [Euryarchaeota archaeon]|nr:type II toxin-antitoxin system VapC family toxin [Euryarchaeota archaeon]MBU4608168.1 type II toxin-antitoxin system VapC family toxin [Euryarchaeota archaeon]MBV1729283.1 type II toxin-antitoxin system VapC family toxin [Methanobacterium sp.]MBV1755687.1 type II toxin-antitoxin system VapC family toxin [Methanobacterium sp.]
MKRLIDESALFDKDFCQYLLQSEEEYYLSALSYLEYLSWQLDKGNTPTMVDAFLAEMNIEIVPFGQKEVKEAIKLAKSSQKNPMDLAGPATATSQGVILISNQEKEYSDIIPVESTRQFMENNK